MAINECCELLAWITYTSEELDEEEAKGYDIGPEWSYILADAWQELSEMELCQECARVVGERT